METINLAVLEAEPTAGDDHAAPVVVVETVEGDDSPSTVRVTKSSTTNGKGTFHKGKLPAAIHAAMTDVFSLPSEIAFRVQGFTVTPKRVEIHVRFWLGKDAHYKADGAGRYALKD